MNRSTRHLSLILATAAVACIVFACSGPQSLTTAVRQADADDYQRLLAAHDNNGREAYFAWYAERMDTSSPQSRLRDANISTTHNPFDARRDSDAVSRGAVIYQTHCASCHGENADGRGPAMVEPMPTMDFHRFAKRFAITVHHGAPRTWFRKISDGYVSEHINADGTQPAMPPFKDTLAREQIWLAITYLQSLDRDAKEAL